MRSIADVVTLIASALHQEHPNKAQQPSVFCPRIRRLEVVSQCSVSLCLTKLNVFWVEEDRREYVFLGNLEQAIRLSLQCPEFRATCRIDCAYLDSLTGLFNRHLRHLSGLGDEQRNYLVSKLVATPSINSSTSSETSFACIVEANLEHALNDFTFDVPCKTNRLCKPLFSIRVDHLQVGFTQMIYENQMSLSARYSALNDADHISILSLDCPLSDSLNGGRRSTVKISSACGTAGSAASMHNLGKGLMSIIDHDSPAAVVLSVRTELLADFAHVAALYQVNKGSVQENTMTPRLFEVKLLCGRSNIVMSSLRSLAVLRSVLSLYCQWLVISSAFDRNISFTQQSGLSKSDNVVFNMEENLNEKEDSPSLKFTAVSRNLVSIECIGEAIQVLVIVDHDLLSCTTLRGSHVRLNFYTNSDNQDTQMSVEDISIIDLSRSGLLHRSIVWTSKQDNFSLKDRKHERQETGSVGGINFSPRQNLPVREKPVESHAIVLDSCRSNGKIQVSVRLLALRLVFLYRLLTEYSDVITNHFVKSVSSLIKDVFMSTSNMETATESFKGQPQTQPQDCVQISVSVLLTELQGLIPRHSFSEEIIGLTLDRVHVKMGFVASSFPDLTRDIVEKIVVSKTPWLHPLFFDLVTNEWREGGQETLCAKSGASHMELDDEEDVTFYDTIASAGGDEISAESKQQLQLLSVLRISVESQGIEIFTSIPHVTASCRVKESGTHRSVTTMGTCLHFETNERLSFESCFGEVSDGQEVLRFPDIQGIRTWQKLSRSKLNLQVIVDILPGRTRLLFGDTRVPSKLDLAVTQAELYLLMNLWFANMNERPYSLTGEEDAGLAEDRAGLDILFDASSLPFEDYGTVNYLSHYLKREMLFDLVVVRGEVSAAIASDINYFPNMPGVLFPKDNLPDLDRSLLAATNERFTVGNSSPGVGFGTRNARDNRRNSLRLGPGGQRRVAPLAELSCLGIVLHVRMDNDVTQMSLSASLCEVYDLMQPQSKSLPLILRLAPHDDPTSHQHLNLREAESIRREGCYRYGYCDFDYGFNQQPDAMEQLSDLPVKLSILLPSSSNWLTMNLGLDLVDLNLCQLDVVWMIAEFFSCFFRFAEFGHPGLVEYYTIDSNKVPYGGIDLRLFITRPHLSLLDVHSPASLFVEAERGVYFRYILDTKSTVKMELNTYDLGVVLMRQYRAPEVSRGARGSSGSGRGIRTMIEFLNTIFRYSNVAAEMQTDIQLEIYIPDDDSGVTESPSLVNLNTNEASADPILIHEPTCLLPVLVSNKDFTPSSTNVVTSYEDIMFCWKLAERILSKRSSSVNFEEAKRASLTDISKTFYNVVVNGVRFLLVDNVLGLHLPLFQVVSVLLPLLSTEFLPLLYCLCRDLWSLYRSSLIVPTKCRRLVWRKETSPTLVLRGHLIVRVGGEASIPMQQPQPLSYPQRKSTATNCTLWVCFGWTTSTV
ncbi:hypothetical protein EON65_17995 [archaeon]|nr:MAG: hypothetical protein EON65_17995 [archaeon]